MRHVPRCVREASGSAYVGSPSTVTANPPPHSGPRHDGRRRPLRAGGRCTAPAGSAGRGSSPDAPGSAGGRASRCPWAPRRGERSASPAGPRAERRAEDSEPGEPVVGRDRREHGRRCLHEQLGVDVAETGRVLELLADSGLGDADGLADETLAHACGHERAQCEHASEPRDFLVAPGGAVHGEQVHRTMFSALAPGSDDVSAARRDRTSGRRSPRAPGSRCTRWTGRALEPPGAPRPASRPERPCRRPSTRP